MPKVFLWFQSMYNQTIPYDWFHDAYDDFVFFDETALMMSTAIFLKYFFLFFLLKFPSFNLIFLYLEHFVGLLELAV